MTTRGDMSTRGLDKNGRDASQDRDIRELRAEVAELRSAVTSRDILAKFLSGLLAAAVAALVTLAIYGAGRVHAAEAEASNAVSLLRQHERESAQIMRSLEYRITQLKGDLKDVERSYRWLRKKDER